jgi:hypothetical protein
MGIGPRVDDPQRGRPHGGGRADSANPHGGGSNPSTRERKDTIYVSWTEIERDQKLRKLRQSLGVSPDLEIVKQWTAK